MRSFVFTVLLFGILLCSCSATADSEGMFDYQESISKVEGILKSGTETYGAVLYFEKTEEGRNVLKRIEYTSPESLSGFVFERNGEEVTVKVGGVTLSGKSFDCERIFSAEKMFTLSAEDIVSIKADENGGTIATGENGSYKWKVHAAKDSLPTRITVSDGNGESTFEIKSIKSDKTK